MTSQVDSYCDIRFSKSNSELILFKTLLEREIYAAFPGMGARVIQFTRLRVQIIYL